MNICNMSIGHYYYFFIVFDHFLSLCVCLCAQIYKPRNLYNCVADIVLWCTHMLNLIERIIEENVYI